MINEFKYGISHETASDRLISGPFGVNDDASNLAETYLSY